MLYTYLLSRLKELSCFFLYIGREPVDIQRLAVKMLTKGYGIVEGEMKGVTVANINGIRLLKGGGRKLVTVFIGKVVRMSLITPRNTLKLL